MNFCELHPIFLALASETLARVHYDRRLAPKRIEPILAYLEHRLFDPNLTANAMYKACDMRDRSISTYFKKAIGHSPWHYIEERRIEVGERLTRLTDVRLTWIALMLGYSSLKVFSNAFFRHTGERPMAYRKKTRRKEAQGDDITPDELRLIVKLKRAIMGRLDLTEVDRLLRRIYALYPNLKPSSTSGLHTLNPAIRRYHL